MEIFEKLLHTTIRIETRLKSGNSSSGTGYFFRFCERENGDYIPVIITNKHVIEGSENGTFYLTMADENNEPIYKNTKAYNLSDFESYWIKHPDPDIDLCAMSLGKLINIAQAKGERLFYMPFKMENLPSENDLNSISAVEEIIMIGYPNGLWDMTNNLPISRRGITATHPKFDFNGKQEFLVDVVCFPGSSGSPIILISKKFNFGFKVLGTLYAGPQYTIVGDIKVARISTKPISLISIPNNLGFVIKSNRIIELEDEVRRVKGS